MAAGTGIATGFFTCAAAGILAALLAVPRAELGRFFSALNAGIAFVLLCLTTPWRFAPPAAVPVGRAGAVPVGPASFGAAAALVLTAAFVTSLYLPGGRGGRGVLPGGRVGVRFLVLAAAAGLLTTALDGLSAAGGAAAWMFGANALAAAALLGSVIVAMILGHWYLVRHGLPERHLVRLSLLFAAAIGVRAALLLAGLVVYGEASPSGLARFLQAVTVERGLFFWQRVFFGILAPAVFAWMVHETARIRSTQSATGILYLAVIFVMIGEFLARYLVVAGAGPM